MGVRAPTPTYPEQMTGPMRLEVVGTEQISPALVRVRFRSDDLSAFAESRHTDRYVKLVFLRDGVDYPEPLDLRALRQTLPPEDQPVVRTYTALEPDVEAGTVAIDFVVHGVEGTAGPWAAAARPGDVVLANGPGGGYAPDPTADWHLLVGDESGLPAVTAALRALPAGATAYVVLEVEGPEGEIELPTTEATTVVWVHRGTGSHAAMTAAQGAVPPLLQAVADLPWPEGRVQAFVHGEAQVVMHALRPYLLGERGLERSQVSISGYWRRGRTEEGFRAWKQELASAEAGR